MLQPVEVLPRRRRSKRHSVSLDAELVCDLWDEPVPHPVRELSEDGLYIESTLPLEPGTEVVLEVSIEDEPMFLFGRVRRAELAREEDAGAGMAIELLDLTEENRAKLALALRSRPPSLPRRAHRPSSELLWVDSLLTYEEQGDVVEVSELLETRHGQAFDRAFDNVTSLAPFVTSTR